MLEHENFSKSGSGSSGSSGKSGSGNASVPITNITIVDVPTTCACVKTTFVFAGDDESYENPFTGKTMKAIQKATFRGLGDFDIITPNNPNVNIKYNCFAWSIGVTDEWMGDGDKYLKKLKDLGYKPEAKVSNTAYEKGYRKIAVYGTGNTAKHAAVQGQDGKWTAKMGRLPVVGFTDPKAMEGTLYGQIIAVYYIKVK